MRKPDHDGVDDDGDAGAEAGAGAGGVFPGPRPQGEQPGCVASTTRRPAPIIGHPSSSDASCLCLQGHHEEEGEEVEKQC